MHTNLYSGGSCQLQTITILIMSKIRKPLIVGVGVVVGVRCIGIVIVRVEYRGGGELVYILPQGQGGKGTDMIYMLTYMHIIYKDI